MPYRKFLTATWEIDEPGFGIEHRAEHQMIGRVAEVRTSEIDLRLETLEGGKLVYESRGHPACLETQGDLEAVLDG